MLEGEAADRRLGQEPEQENAVGVVVGEPLTGGSYGYRIRRQRRAAQGGLQYDGGAFVEGTPNPKL